MKSIPIVDLAQAEGASARIAQACREEGFFYVVGHGVDLQLVRDLETRARSFFAWPEERKRELDMRHGGRAWRGYFGVGDELTSGVPDQKEGLYFGAESGPDHPKVRSGAPFFGANLFPSIEGFAEAVHEYMQQLTKLGHRLARELSSGLDLEPDAIEAQLTRDPLILFRIFHYPPFSPPTSDVDQKHWSVGEHTDYGLLTILAQDDVGGLEVRTPSGWVAAPVVPGALICNIGDMLERLSGGVYRSTAHRVLNRGTRGRVSLAFFFDPNVDARIEPLTGAGSKLDDSSSRWDGTSVHQFDGTYGEYLLRKVSRVFPDLERKVL